MTYAVGFTIIKYEEGYVFLESEGGESRSPGHIRWFLTFFNSTSKAVSALVVALTIVYLPLDSVFHLRVGSRNVGAIQNIYIIRLNADLFVGSPT